MPSVWRALLQDALGLPFEAPPTLSAKEAFFSPARQSEASRARSAARQRAAAETAAAEEADAWWAFDDDDDFLPADSPLRREYEAGRRRRRAKGTLEALESALQPADDPSSRAADADHRLALCGVQDLGLGRVVVVGTASAATPHTPHLDECGATPLHAALAVRGAPSSDENTPSAAQVTASLSRLLQDEPASTHGNGDAPAHAYLALLLALSRGAPNADAPICRRVATDALLDQVDEDALRAAREWFLNWLADHTERAALTFDERDDLHDTDDQMACVWSQLRQEDAAESRQQYAAARRRRLCRIGWAHVAYTAAGLDAFARAWATGSSENAALQALVHAMRGVGATAAALASGHCFDAASVARVLDPTNGSVAAAAPFGRTTLVTCRAADGVAANACVACTRCAAFAIERSTAARVRHLMAAHLGVNGGGHGACDGGDSELAGVALEVLQWRHSLDGIQPEDLSKFIDAFEAQRAANVPDVSGGAGGGESSGEAVDPTFASVAEHVFAVATAIASIQRLPCARYGEERLCLRWFSETCRYEPDALLAALRADEPPEVGKLLCGRIQQALPPRSEAPWRVLPASAALAGLTLWVQSAVAIDEARRAT